MVPSSAATALGRCSYTAREGTAAPLGGLSGALPVGRGAGGDHRRGCMNLVNSLMWVNLTHPPEMALEEEDGWESPLTPPVALSTTRRSSQKRKIVSKATPVPTQVTGRGSQCPHCAYSCTQPGSRAELGCSLGFVLQGLSGQSRGTLSSPWVQGQCGSEESSTHLKLGNLRCCCDPRSASKMGQKGGLWFKPTLCVYICWVLGHQDPGGFCFAEWRWELFGSFNLSLPTHSQSSIPSMRGG